jgi:hypothetical protein
MAAFPFRNEGEREMRKPRSQDKAEAVVEDGIEAVVWGNIKARY